MSDLQNGKSITHIWYCKCIKIIPNVQKIKAMFINNCISSWDYVWITTSFHCNIVPLYKPPQMTHKQIHRKFTRCQEKYSHFILTCTSTAPVQWGKHCTCAGILSHTKCFVLFMCVLLQLICIHIPNLLLNHLMTTLMMIVNLFLTH